MPAMAVKLEEFRFVRGGELPNMAPERAEIWSFPIFNLISGVFSKSILPNLITLGNLFCGVLALALLAERGPGHPNSIWVVYLVLIGLGCDFFDGLVARALNATSEMGKQLDSLSDLVTFGVLPGMLMYSVLRDMPELFGETGPLKDLLSYVPLLIPLATAWRLARFNIANAPMDHFQGLPAPANGIFFVSLFAMGLHLPSDFDFVLQGEAIVLLTLGLAVLMVTRWPLLALKFSTFSPRPNLSRYLFLGISLALLLILQWDAGPAVMALYLLLSLIDHLFLKSS